MSLVFITVLLYGIKSCGNLLLLHVTVVGCIATVSSFSFAVPRMGAGFWFEAGESTSRHDNKYSENDEILFFGAKMMKC